jgi:hypothetical protein
MIYLRKRLNFLLPHDVKTNNQKYPIFSQYYDTDNLQFYFQKEDGEYIHEKIRFRQYSDHVDKDGKVWLETKQKRDLWQIKQRDEFPDMKSAKEFLNSKYKTSKNNFFYLRNIKSNLVPSANVFYEREAFEIITDEDRLRVTFDSNLIALHPQQTDLKNISPSQYLLTPIVGKEQILLEVKYNKAIIPKWLEREIQGLGLERTSYSKYGSSVERLMDLKKSNLRVK